MTRSAGPPAREQRFVFDEAAELYARTRPGYPRELIEDLIREAALGPGARVLELGAGPGTASAPFAGRGYRLHCLEPGPQLAALARARLAAEPGARVEVTTFEAWPLEAARFDLVFAAQSFHWIDPAVRFAKAARALRPGGTLAIFANRPLPGGSTTHARIQQAYAEHAPELRGRGDVTNTCENFLAMFAGASEFGRARCREYAFHEDYDVARYLDLLRTHSNHRLLPAARLERLLHDVAAAIEASGTPLRIDYASVLCFARVAIGG